MRRNKLKRIPRKLLGILAGLLFFLAMAPGSHCGEKPARVISVAPNITEICFALGAEDRLVGVTRFCDYPAAATQIENIGGFLDPNYEKMISLKPDLVLLLKSNEETRRQLETLGVRTLSVNDEGIDDILAMIAAIGEELGKEEEAAVLAGKMRKEIESVKEMVRDREPLRAIICFNRQQSGDSLESVYAGAEGSLFDEILTIAGGRQVVPNRGMLYPQLSAEGLLMLEPEIIIELVGDMTPEEIRQAEAQWAQLFERKVIRADRIYVIPGLYAVRPGPRTIGLLKSVARCLHPELEWGK